MQAENDRDTRPSEDRYSLNERRSWAIGAIRKALGLSVDQMAELIGVSPETISAMETVQDQRVQPTPDEGTPSTLVEVQNELTPGEGFTIDCVPYGRIIVREANFISAESDDPSDSGPIAEPE